VASTSQDRPQAFFPDRSAWQRLERALRGTIDSERFDALTGTTSLPFKPGKHKRVAAKVIDPRGNEVMRVLRLSEQNHRMTAGPKEMGRVRS
jgi:adenine-specific DNA-methyltransferase